MAAPFVDIARITVRAGKGGNGAGAFHRGEEGGAGGASPPKTPRLGREPEQSPAERVCSGKEEQGSARSFRRSGGGSEEKRTLRRRGPGGHLRSEGGAGHLGAFEVSRPAQQDNTEHAGPPVRAALYYLTLFIQTVIAAGRNGERKRQMSRRRIMKFVRCVSNCICSEKGL